jgi:hypothetical protein
MTDFNQILSESFTTNPRFRHSPTETEAIFRIRVTTLHPRAIWPPIPQTQASRGAIGGSDSPLTTHQSPLTSHHSPVTTHQSPLTSYHSPIGNHQSAITNRQSPIGNHQSAITNRQAPSGNRQNPLGRDRRLPGRLPMEPAIGRVLTGTKLARWAWRASTNCLLKATPGTRIRDGVPSPRSNTPAKQWVPDGNGSRNGTAVQAQLAEFQAPIPGGSSRQPL